MSKRSAAVERKTKETEIRIELNIEGNGTQNISTGVPFFDHMLTLFSVHGFFDLTVEARGDLEVDSGPSAARHLQISGHDVDPGNPERPDCVAGGEQPRRQ